MNLATALIIRQTLRRLVCSARGVFAIANHGDQIVRLKEEEWGSVVDGGLGNNERQAGDGRRTQSVQMF